MSEDKTNGGAGGDSTTAGMDEIIEAKSLVESYPPDVRVTLQEGLLCAAMCILQCVGCGSKLAITVVKEKIVDLDEIASIDAVCPVCTGAQGKPVVIELAVLVGSQVEQLDESLDKQPDDEEQPTASDAPPSTSESSGGPAAG